MKRFGLFALGIVILVGMVGCFGGDDFFGPNVDCSQQGRLLAFNGSPATTQELLVDGRSMAVLPPGEWSDGITLDLGVHTVQMRGVSGGPGCASLTVDIEPCDHKIIECES